MSGMHIAQHISPMVDVVSQLESRVEDLEDQVRAQKILAQVSVHQLVLGFLSSLVAP